MTDFNDPLSAITSVVEALQSENSDLKESLSDIKAQMAYEDRGWKLLRGGTNQNEEEEGFTLDEIQEMGKTLSAAVAGGSLPKRAVDLHAGFVWGKGCYIEGTEAPKGSGKPKAIRRVFIDPVNQDSVFSDVAREELQKSRFIHGNVIVTVNDVTKKVHRIPFSQIKDIRVDPDFPENVIAYLREWDTQDGTKDSVKKVWIYTHRYEGERAKTFTVNKERVKVAPNETIVDLRVNRQPGYIHGVPDGLAGILWAEAYSKSMKVGMVVSESLSRILFQITNRTPKGAKTAGLRTSEFGGHGGTASMGSGQELSAVSTAGKGYDFASLRPIAANAASAWNVSNMDLLNDSSAAGSSYGSAQALVGGNRNAMLMMQLEWAKFYKDIFSVLLGPSQRPTIVFEPFETPDKYRELQAIKLGSDALSDEEYRMAVLEALDIVGDPTEIPDSLKADIDSNAGVQQGSPDQGKSNKTNSGGKGSKDLRDDTVSKEALRQEMAQEDYLARLERLVERAEQALVERDVE